MAARHRELHFSRLPHSRWREALLKLRADGLTAVSCYLFWLHYEETEGEPSFAGNLDIRHFTEVCGQVGLDLIIRIGPRVHAEASNGGLNDWVLVGCDPRSDDPIYLARVHRWYEAVAGQVRGLDHDSGGPIIAVQIENEYHAGSDHLRELKHIAVDAGLRAPLWTATAWGLPTFPATSCSRCTRATPTGFWFGADEERPADSVWSRPKL